MRSGEVPVEEFLKRLPEVDDEWQARMAAFREDDQQAHFLAVVQNGKLQARVQPVPFGSPFSNLSETDNLIAFTTERYLTMPLVVRGPGAGPEVTAAGVMADLIKAVQTV